MSDDEIRSSDADAVAAIGEAQPMVELLSAANDLRLALKRVVFLGFGDHSPDEINEAGDAVTQAQRRFVDARRAASLARGGA